MPASFPASVKTFTTKLDGTGNPINAAHINDIQDEVNAIEAGYLNATARLNSSASTLASLDVTGGSTLEGRLQVTGASTFTLRPLTPPPEAALVYLQAPQTIGSSAVSTLVFTADAFLINSSMHSTVTNAERLTPQSTGVYKTSAQVSLTANSTGGRDFGIIDSSGTFVGEVVISSGGDAFRLQVSGYKRFDLVGGYLTARLAMTGVTTMSASSGTDGSWFALAKL